MTKKNVALLFLKTGGGHEAAARALAEKIIETGKGHPIMLDPLKHNLNIVRELIEGGYSRLSGNLKFMWPLLYKMSYSSRRIKTIHEITRVLFTDIIVEQLIKTRPERIVILHYLLIAPVRRAIEIAGLENSLTVTIVLDIFSVHPLWFLDNPFPIYCFSDEAADTIMSNNSNKQREITQFPVLISDKFLIKGKPEVSESKQGTSRNILILSGGEGSYASLRYLRTITKNRPDLSIDFICGKSVKLLRGATKCCKNIPGDERVFIHGFVNNIENFLSEADLILTKAGPASIMECLLIGKPLIIYDYMYGQEQGNVDFIEKNNLGIFIENPRNLIEAIDYFLSTEYRHEFKKNLRKLNLKIGTGEIVSSIMEGKVLQCG